MLRAVWNLDPCTPPKQESPGRPSSHHPHIIFYTDMTVKASVALICDAVAFFLCHELGEHFTRTQQGPDLYRIPIQSTDKQKIGSRSSYRQNSIILVFISGICTSTGSHTRILTFSLSRELENSLSCFLGLRQGWRWSWESLILEKQPQWLGRYIRYKCQHRWEEEMHCSYFTARQMSFLLIAAIW